MAHLSKILLPLSLIIFLAAPALRSQSATDSFPATPATNYSAGLLKWLSTFLTPDQLTEFERTLFLTMQDSPELVQDGIALAKEGQTRASDLAPADRDAYIQKLRDYEGRLRVAMSKEDPDIGKIFDQIDAHLPRPANP